MDHKFQKYSGDFSPFCEITNFKYEMYPLHNIINYFEVYLILIDQFGLKIEYGGEKTAFTILFNFKNIPCAISLEKSGLHLYTQKDNTEKFQLITTLKKLKKEINRIYQGQAKELILSGNVTIKNNSNFMYNRFTFLNEIFEKIESRELFHEENYITSVKSMYVFISVIESWFAWLEHICILLLAVSKYEPSKDNILEFVSSNWTEKYHRVFNPDGNNSYYSKKYNELKSIKERIRNSYCHGGIRKNNSEILVHWKGIGAIPYILSDTDIYPDLNWQNLVYDFQKDLKVIKDFNNEFINGSDRLKYELVHSGLNISFSPKSIEKLQNVINDEESLYSYLEYECGYQDAVANFEI